MLETSLDLSYHYDENLQDVPNHPEEMCQAVEFWQDQLSQSNLDTTQRIELLGRLGGYARTLRDLDLAEQALGTALELAESIGNVRLKTANTIKLAHVYQWQQRYAESETLFAEAIATCQTHPDAARYLDFAYQHFGKCKFDQGQYSEALGYFQQAMEIRQEKGNLELIESTALAIATTQSRQQAH